MRSAQGERKTRLAPRPGEAGFGVEVEFAVPPERRPRSRARRALPLIALVAWFARADDLPPAPPPPDPYADLVRRGAEAFAERDDAARLGEAIARFTEASALHPGEREAELLLARAQAFRAEAWPREAKDAWREASRAAERALRRASPGFAEASDRGDAAALAAGAVGAAGAEPLYWLARATMGMAQSRGMAAVLAVKDAARSMMERAAQLDERVDHAGPRRALGAWLAALPSAAGGGAAASRASFERARALAPAYLLARVREAEVLAVLLQDRPRFDALLAETLAFDVAKAPEVAPENRLAQRLARELQARRDRLF